MDVGTQGSAFVLFCTDTSGCDCESVKRDAISTHSLSPKFQRVLLVFVVFPCVVSDFLDVDSTPTTKTIQ